MDTPRCSLGCLPPRPLAASVDMRQRPLHPHTGHGPAALVSLGSSLEVQTRRHSPRPADSGLRLHRCQPNTEKYWHGLRRARGWGRVAARASVATRSLQPRHRRGLADAACLLGPTWVGLKTALRVSLCFRVAALNLCSFSSREYSLENGIENRLEGDTV